MCVLTLLNCFFLLLICVIVVRIFVLICACIKSIITILLSYCLPFESSTEAMDTDEGQRTTARLLEEACRLSTAAMEPSYATIDESMSTTLQGSEAAISDILATQDPRKLNKSETGERGPTPVEMKAGLPVGSFSPFNFEKEFQMRHGVSPEDADKPWQSYHQS